MTKSKCRATKIALKFAKLWATDWDARLSWKQRNKVYSTLVTAAPSRSIRGGACATVGNKSSFRLFKNLIRRFRRLHRFCQKDLKTVLALLSLSSVKSA